MGYLRGLKFVELLPYALYSVSKLIRTNCSRYLLVYIFTLILNFPDTNYALVFCLISANYVSNHQHGWNITAVWCNSNLVIVVFKVVSVLIIL